MKKNDGLILLATLSYGYLFYLQAPGLNHLVFDVLLICIARLYHLNSLLTKRFWFASVVLISAGIAVAWHGTAMSIFANILGLLVFGGAILQPKSSVLSTVLSSFITTAGSVVFSTMDGFARLSARNANNPGRAQTNWLNIILPLLAVVLFVILYSSASPVFANMLGKIDLSFISIGWVFFTLTGFFVVYAILNHRVFEPYHELDKNAGNDAVFTGIGIKFFGKQLAISEEIKSGFILLACLNALLFIVNALDLNSFVSGVLPDNMTFSQFVHQGTTSVIISVILAIGIVLFYFRGDINFVKENRSLRALAYIWLGQQFLLMFSTAYRNHLYIEEYLLTYKRLGVYLFLLTTAAGIVVTIYKIYSKKSNYFLIRVNGWIVLVAIVFAANFPAANCVISYNLSKQTKPNTTIDFNYLISLSPVSLPALIQYNKSLGNVDDFAVNQARISRLLVDFSDKCERLNWRSWNLDYWFTYQQLKRQTVDITELRFDYVDIQSLSALREFQYITKISFKNAEVQDCSSLRFFKNLAVLDLQKSPGFSNAFIQNEGKLKVLTIRQCNLFLVPQVNNPSTIKELDLSYNYLENLADLKNFRNVEVLNLQGNLKLRSFDVLKDLTQLKTLYVDGKYRDALVDVQVQNPQLTIHYSTGL